MNIVSKLKNHFHYDPESGDIFRKKKWRDQPAMTKVGSKTCNGRYLSSSMGSVYYRAHIIAWALMTDQLPENEIDHINGDGCDNRWVNLRQATRQQNNINQTIRKDNTSGFKGVVKQSRSKTWKVQLNVDGKRCSKTGFTSKEQAAHAYDLWAVDVYGSFAKLNYRRPYSG